MEKVISNISSFFFKIFIFSLSIGALLGFVCSNGIFTINFNPDNAKTAIKKTAENIKKNGTAFVESIRNEDDEYGSNGSIYSNDQNFENTSHNNFHIHQVQQGETLYDIGLKYGIHWKAIMRINDIPNPHSIHPNDEILIPIRY